MPKSAGASPAELLGPAIPLAEFPFEVHHTPWGFCISLQANGLVLRSSCCLRFLTERAEYRMHCRNCGKLATPPGALNDYFIDWHALPAWVELVLGDAYDPLEVTIASVEWTEFFRSAAERLGIIVDTSMDSVV